MLSGLRSIMATAGFLSPNLEGRAGMEIWHGGAAPTPAIAVGFNFLFGSVGQFGLVIVLLQSIIQFVDDARRQVAARPLGSAQPKAARGKRERYL